MSRTNQAAQMNPTTPEPVSRQESIDSVQAGEYAFPYHYIPAPKGYLKFSRRWHYAPSYIAAVNLASRWLTKVIASSSHGQHLHMDFGCGDGGFLFALNQDQSFRGVCFEGIDIDGRAIRWAEAFSDGCPNVKFRRQDIQTLTPCTYDSGSLVEVFEHIPPAEADTFVVAIAKSLKPGANLFVTVPSTEVPVSSKHYRHFDFDSLAGCFSDHFEVHEIFGFERGSFIGKALKSLMFGQRIYIETSLTSKYLVREFERRHDRLSGCGRIGMVLRRK